MVRVVFTAPKIKTGLEPSTKIDPASNANFTKTKIKRSLAGVNCDVTQTMDFLVTLIFVDEKMYMYCPKTKYLEDCK